MSGCRVVLVWKGTVDAGESLETGEVGGVEREAEVCERTEAAGDCRGSCGGEHSGGGGGGLGEGSALFEDGYAGSAAWSSRASERPMMPAPAMQMSGCCI